MDRTNLPRRAAALVLACAALALPASAQVPGSSGGTLESARKMREVAAQKLEADVRQTLRDAGRRPDTAAVERLEKLLEQVEDSPDLSDARRVALRRSLQDQVRVLQVRESPSEVELARSGRRDGDLQQAREAEEMKRLVEGVRQLQRTGRGAEAARQAGALSGRQPGSPTAEALRRSSSIQEQLEANRRLREGRAGGLAGGLRGVERSGTLPGGEIEYPPGWREKTQTRSSSVSITARERKILTTLDTAVTVRLKDSPLESAIDYLQTLTGLPIVVDKTTLEEAGVTYQTPVTLNLKGVTVRTALRKMLGDVGLTYIVKDEVVEIMTPQRARETLTARVYYVGDLVAAPPNIYLNAAWLIDLIQRTIDPQSWQVNGGPGTIVFDPVRLSLVVKQSAEFHGKLSSVLTVR
jgi:hypothetical protein